MRFFNQNILWLLIISGINCQTVLCQNNSEIDTLSLEQRVKFETVARDVFDELENLTLILIDPEEDLDLRREASFLASLFFDYKANIEDYIGVGNNYVESHTKDIYYKKLIELSNRVVFLTKDLTLLSSVKFEKGCTGLNTENQDYFRIYTGSVEYLDQTGISDIVERVGLAPENLITKRSEFIKKMTFEIRKTAIPDVRWQLFIKKIEIIKKKNEDFSDFKTLAKRTPNKPSSERIVNPRSLEEVIASLENDDNIPNEVKQPLLDELKLIASKDDSTNNEDIVEVDIDESSKYLGLNALDFIVPGKGHLKYNKKGKAWIPTMTYMTLGAGALGTAVYFKLKSNSFYRLHKKARTFGDLHENYGKAESLHRNFLIGLGAVVLVWGTNAGHLLLKDMNQRPTKRISFNLYPSVNFGEGYSLAMKLKF